MNKQLTVAMAAYGPSESNNVWFTCEALRTYHGYDFDLVVVNSGPEDCRHMRAVTEACRGKYVWRPDLTGTSAPRDHVFELAQTEWVMCIDSHIFLVPDAVRHFHGFIAQSPNCTDIVSGPLFQDNGEIQGYKWGGDETCGLWGIWVHPEWEEKKRAAMPFEIPMMGLGLFAMRKEAWPGFNPLFRGFGGEEGYIHEKVRQQGGKAICLPWLGWRHKFRDTKEAGKGDPTPYPCLIQDHTFNLLVGHRELGIDAVAKIHRHFGDRMHPLMWAELVKESERVQPFGEWARTQTPLDKHYRKELKRASTINQHMPTLKKLACEASEVVEFGVQTAQSTAALLAGRPERMRSFDIQYSQAGVEVLKMAAPETLSASFTQTDTLSLAPQASDLLFIDTLHTCEQLYQELYFHSTHCRRRIVMHDTAIFGDVGEDKGPGLREAIRRFLKEAGNYGWHVMSDTEVSCGLTVLSSDPKDPWQYPDWLGDLIPKLNILGIWYTNNKAPASLMKRSLQSIEKAGKSSRHNVNLTVSCWDTVEGLPPGTPYAFAEDRNGNHVTITRQMKQCLDLAEGWPWEIVCFLEHDTLYPPDYFDRVGRAFLENPSAPVVSNMDYEGLNATGWLAVRERHEPMHQLSLRRDVAIENLARCERDFLAAVPGTLLEPQSGPDGDRSNWARIPYTGAMPSIHVNFHGRFTSHGEVVYEQDSHGKVMHRFWGYAGDYWPGDLDGKVPPLVGPKNGWGVPALLDLYGRVFAEHADNGWQDAMMRLRRISAGQNHVTLISGGPTPAFIALATGRPKQLLHVCPGGDPSWNAFLSKHVSMGQNTTLKTNPSLDPFWLEDTDVTPTDVMVFSDTPEADRLQALLVRHAAKSRQKVVICLTPEMKEQEGAEAWLQSMPEWGRKDAPHGILVFQRVGN
jgi:hypothetical protein